MHLLSKTTTSLLGRRNGTALCSTNAALDLHHHFWDSFENRSLMHGKQCDCKPLPLLDQVQKDLKDYSQAQDQLMKNAHEDMFKHFRMNASLRAMKRGDGVLSDQFVLSGAAVLERSPVVSHVDREMTLIDVETARKAREDMHYNFWRAHEARRDAASAQHQQDEEAKIHDFKSKHETMTPHAVHPDRSRSRLPLPTNLEDILMEFGHHAPHHSKHPAMAITETQPPFKIVDVNKAWVDLCGYSRKNAIGSTLKLLQGPDTNVNAANDLVSSLLAEKETGEGEGEYETVLTNYRSDGRRFRNHIRVGLVRDDSGKVVNFVGCFKRLDDDDEMII